MAKDKKYTGADIKALSDREHVRLRTQVYLGNMHPTVCSIPVIADDGIVVEDLEFIPAVYKAIGEVIDNAVDEFSQITIKNKLLKITADPEKGTYTIADNGRGIPIDMHATGKRTPEVALGSLKAGRNFTDDKEVGVIGQNGVGAACTNYCSSEFSVAIHRDGKKYVQTFTNGADKVSTPKITTAAGASGTAITFTLDPKVFKSTALPEQLIQNRAREIALTNPDITVEYNGTRYRYKKGMQELVSLVADTSTFHSFELDSPSVAGEIYVVLDAHDEIDEQMFTWVNSSLLFDGGKCNTQFINAFYEQTAAHLASRAKKEKTAITRNDVRKGLLILANLKIKNPEYDSQAKTRLTGPDLRKELVEVVEREWKSFARKSSVWLDQVMERATKRHHKEADTDAINEHKKKSRKSVAGLLDATSSDRSSCRLLVTEGDSAQSQICEVRNPKTTAAYALTGKINNVFGCTPAQALKMEKIGGLLVAIGLTPGKPAIRSQLNYGQVVIATDADYDGDDIFTLLVNLFYHFWPELFDPKYEPFIVRLVAPNICLVKGEQRIHFPSRTEYEKVKSKYKGYEVRYYKGLGAMEPDDWKIILDQQDTTNIIPITDDGKLNNVLTLLFDDNADSRKTWLSTQ